MQQFNALGLKVPSIQTERKHYMMKAQTINEVDIAELLRRAKTISGELHLLQVNYGSANPDHEWLCHQQKTLERLILEISDEEIPWWRQIQRIDQLVDTIRHIRCRMRCASYH